MGEGLERNKTRVMAFDISNPIKLRTPQLCCVKVHNVYLLVRVPVVVSAGSPSINGAVIRKVLVTDYIQFIFLLVAYSSLPAVAVLCLMPYA